MSFVFRTVVGYDPYVWRFSRRDVLSLAVFNGIRHEVYRIAIHRVDTHLKMGRIAPDEVAR